MVGRWSADHLPTTFLRCSLFTITHIACGQILIATCDMTTTGHFYSSAAPFTLQQGHRNRCDGSTLVASNNLYFLSFRNFVSQQNQYQYLNQKSQSISSNTPLGGPGEGKQYRDLKNPNFKYQPYPTLTPPH